MFVFKGVAKEPTKSYVTATTESPGGTFLLTKVTTNGAMLIENCGKSYENKKQRLSTNIHKNQEVQCIGGGEGLLKWLLKHHKHFTLTAHSGFWFYHPALSWQKQV